MDKERRVVEFAGQKAFIRYPTIEENRLADIEYSKAYHQFLKQDLPLALELENLLKSRGIFSTLNDKIQAATDHLQKSMIELKEETQADKREVLLAQYKVAKVNLLESNTERNKYLTNSVENKAEESKTVFLISRVTQKEDGSLYWASLEELKNESNIKFVQMIVYRFVMMVNDLSENFLDEVPDFLATASPEVVVKTEEPVSIVTSVTEVPVG